MKLLLKYRLFILFLFCFLGCSSGLDKDEIIVNQISKETAERLKQQKNLYLFGTGGGMVHGIRKLSMSFNFYHEVDFNEARELVVYAMQEYLSAINSNEEVRPFLCNYPFKPENIEIAIFFYKPDGQTVSPGQIIVAGNEKESISYYVDDPEKYTIKRIYKETYEEALKATEKNSLPQDEKIRSNTTADGMRVKQIPSNT